MKPPEITTLICSKDHGKYLKDAIRSILDQTFKPTELILIDDGSSDNTWEVVSRETKGLPGIIRIKHELCSGNIHSYNEGIALATKDFFHLMAADDVVCDRHFYEDAVKVLLTRPNVAFCATGLQWMDADKTLLPQQSIPPVGGSVSAITALELMRIHGNFTNGGGVLIRTAVQKKIGGYDERNRYSADYLNWIKVFECGYDAYYFQKPGYLYRRHGNQMTTVVAADLMERKICQDRLDYALRNLKTDIPAA